MPAQSVTAVQAFLLKEELALHSLPGGSADSQKDQKAALQEKRRQRVHRPADEADLGKGHRQQKFQHQEQSAKTQQTAAENVQPASSKIAQQGYHRCHQQADAARHGKGKA